MSIRARKRRYARRHPRVPPVVAEAAALPAYNRARTHSWYAADALRSLTHWAPRSGVRIRGDLFPMPM